METKTLPLHFDKITTQKIEAEWLNNNEVSLDILRLDLLHPIISGNKWFKLKYYLLEAQQLGKATIATFGGAYSNHILATAFACKSFGLQSVGFIRGEQPEDYSTTLQQAEEYGMKLIFISRDQYRQKEKVADEFKQFNWYWIAEGGYGSTGAKGAEDILKYTNSKIYTHILASVGTGTMLGGLLMSAEPTQQVIGISSMKGNTSLEKAVANLITPLVPDASIQIIHDYHFGGYGKHPDHLIEFIKQTNEKHDLPLDIVYTGKLFYGIKDLVGKKYFTKGSKLLMIHSGGLQGNASLEDNVLSFL
jgi:1-aminocyclopropane-1-carboxylate deaminase